MSSIASSGQKIIDDVKRLTHDNINAGIKLDEIETCLSVFEEAHRSIIDTIDKAKQNLVDDSLHDPIGNQVVNLFDCKVGQPPASQDELDALLADAEIRFGAGIPPGYKDGNAKNEGSFFDGEICYKNKFGDLILWRQTLDFAKANNLKQIIFITDDSKSDWWDIDGPLTRGPLPALLQEMRRKGGVELFWMYKSDQFLKYAQEYLQAPGVTREAIEQAKGISDFAAQEARMDEISRSKTAFKDDTVPDPDQPASRKMRLAEFGARHGNNTVPYKEPFHVHFAISAWIEQMFHGDLKHHDHFPEFTIILEHRIVGWDIKYYNLFGIGQFITVKSAISRARDHIQMDMITSCVIIVVVDRQEIDRLFDEGTMLTRLKNSISGFDEISILFGWIRDEQFFPAFNLNSIPFR